MALYMWMAQVSTVSPPNTLDLPKDNVEGGRGNGSDEGDCGRGKGKLGSSFILFLLLPQPVKVKVEF